MKPEEAATILQSLVDGRDPSSGQELPADAVYQRAEVIRALLVGCAAIESSLARDKRRAQLPKRVGTAWTAEEDEKLRYGFQTDRSVEALASSHQRTPNSIRARLERLNLIPPEQRSTFPRFPFSEGADEKPRPRRRRAVRHDQARDPQSSKPVAKKE